MLSVTILAITMLGLAVSGSQPGQRYESNHSYSHDRVISVITDYDDMVEVVLTRRHLIVTPIHQTRYRRSPANASVSVNIPGPGFEVILRKDVPVRSTVRRPQPRYYPIESVRNLRHHRGELVIVHQHGRRTVQEYVRLDGPRSYPLEFSKRDVKRMSEDLRRAKKYRRR
ncbi:MAG: hypothetical protein ACNA8K_13310 [Cyclonatronaceae bacterium]